MRRKSKSKQNKQQLLAALMSQGIRKGFLQSETILKQLSRYNLSEEEKEAILLEFEQAGVSIIFPEMESLDTVYDMDSELSYLDELKQECSSIRREPKNGDPVIPDPHR